MKMRKFKITSGLLALSMLSASTFALTGCQGNKNFTESLSSVSISFSWWGNDSRHLYTMEAVDAFQEENPDIDVSYIYGDWNGFERKTQVYNQSGTEADVMQINYGWLDIYSPTGDGYYDLYELSDYIDFSNFDKADLSFGEINGKLNALPIAFNTSTIYYNKDIFETHNLEIPETWDDLFEAAKVLKQDNIYPLGMAKKQVFLMLIAYFEQTTDKKFFDKSGHLLLSNQDMEMVLDFYKRLVNEQVIPPLDQWNRDMLAEGSVAGSVFWISDCSKYCESIEKSGGTPILGNYITTTDAFDSGWYMKPATMYAISKRTEAPEQAALLLNYLLNSPQMALLQGTEKGIPVSKASYETLESQGMLSGYGVDANTKMLNERENIHIIIPAMENEEIINIFKESADKYLYDKMSLQDTAEEINAGIRRIKSTDK